MAINSYSTLRRIPCVWMRGGTSKAAFFHAHDLPTDPTARDALLLQIMGSPDARQVDGLGGGSPLTTKIALVSKSVDDHADINYLFGQVVIGEGRIDYAPTCGNILAAVGPFALEEGLYPAQDGETIVRIRMTNTGGLCHAVLSTPAGRMSYHGDTAISGVPGTAAAIELRFSEVAGSSCGALYPTGNRHDMIDGLAVTCIDNGMPVVVIRASDLGVSGYETPAELDANTPFKERLERLRRAAGPLMGLGDVTHKVVPKMTLIAPARDGGALCTRSFIPKKCHDAIGVLGAASVATAFADTATVCHSPAHEQRQRDISVEHPTGEFTIRLTYQNGLDQAPNVALLRTARPLMVGFALSPL